MFFPRVRNILLIMAFFFGIISGPGVPEYATAAGLPVNGLNPAFTKVSALYIVFEKSAGQPAVPVFTREVEVTATLDDFPGNLGTSAISQAMQMGENLDTPIAVILQDTSGQVVYQTVVTIPRWQRAEFHGAEPGDPIDGQWLPLESSAFVVRIPFVPGTRLALSDSTGESLGIYSFSDLEAQAEAGSFLLSATASQLTTVAATGSPANRVDLIVLGDGYTAAQQDQFNADVQATMDAFFAVDPYNDYRNFFNVVSLFTASVQSGADQPPYQDGCIASGSAGNPATCCPESGGTGAGNVSTAFDATFCSYQVQRLLTVNYSKVYAAAAANPDYDHIIVIVNDSTYGGSGGSYAVTSMHTSAPQIAQHEFGHSFVGLADEYTSSLPSPRSCSDAGAHPNCAANITDVTDRALIKWHPWILDTTPIPTDENNTAFASVVGLFQGAFYQTTGYYRSGQNCIMRSLGQPFCQVPAQEFALTLYRGGWGVPANGIRLIEPGTASPSSTNTNLTHPAKQTFQATALKPEGGALLITWLVDGQVAASGVSSSFQYQTEASKPGVHEIRMRVKDASGYIHPEMGGTVDQFDQVWTVNVTVPSIVVSLTGTPTTPLVADGVSSATLTAQATLNSNPVLGEFITFSSPIGTFSKTKVETNAEGKATVTLKSTKSGSAVVTATNGVSLAQFTITFIPGPPAAIVALADRTLMGAGIKDQGYVYGRVQDAFANGISGTNVTFTTTLGTLSSLSGITGPDGKAAVLLTSPDNPGTATIKVSGAGYTDTITVDFVIFKSRLFLPVAKK